MGFSHLRFTAPPGNGVPCGPRTSTGNEGCDSVFLFLRPHFTNTNGVILPFPVPRELMRFTAWSRWAELSDLVNFVQHSPFCDLGYCWKSMGLTTEHCDLMCSKPLLIISSWLQLPSSHTHTHALLWRPLFIDRGTNQMWRFFPKSEPISSGLLSYQRCSSRHARESAVGCGHK